MSTQVALITVEEYLKLPEPREGHTELHHGEVVVMPPPQMDHQVVQDNIQNVLKRLTIGRGRVFMEMAFRPMPEYEVWQADVAYLTPERAAGFGGRGYLFGAPDIVVEVLSPSNTMDEIKDRMEICLNNGCSSFWVADPKRKQLSVTEGRITTHYGIADTFECSILPGPINVREIFE